MRTTSCSMLMKNLLKDTSLWYLQLFQRYNFHLIFSRFRKCDITFYFWCIDKWTKFPTGTFFFEKYDEIPIFSTPMKVFFDKNYIFLDMLSEKTKTWSEFIQVHNVTLNHRRTVQETSTEEAEERHWPTSFSIWPSTECSRLLIHCQPNSTHC